MKANRVMYVNGKLLADYLKKYGIGKIEFLDALTKDDPYYSFDEEGMDICDGRLCDLGLELYDGVTALDEITAKRFIKLIGYDHAIRMIEWRVQELDDGFIEDARKYIIVNNAYKSKTLQTSVGCF